MLLTDHPAGERLGNAFRCCRRAVPFAGRILAAGCRLQPDECGEATMLLARPFAVGLRQGRGLW